MLDGELGTFARLFHLLDILFYLSGVNPATGYKANHVILFERNFLLHGVMQYFGLEG